jgi:catechol 2,3-dioxygenase-like lactoylglutathione lyase family enzyme
LNKGGVVKLGESVEIAISCKDVGKSREFYQKLGFTELVGPQKGTVLADGQIRLSLHEMNFPTPVLIYFSPDPAERVKALKEQGIGFVNIEEREGRILEAGFSDPNSQEILLVRLERDELLVPKTQGKSGFFGELSIPTSDLKASRAFWEKLGFTYFAGDESNVTHPWVVMRDGLMDIGIHQTRNFVAPALTYFARDMVERIEGLKKEGIQFLSEQKDSKGRTTYGVARAPDGQQFFLFYADYDPTAPGEGI